MISPDESGELPNTDDDDAAAEAAHQATIARAIASPEDFAMEHMGVTLSLAEELRSFASCNAMLRAELRRAHEENRALRAQLGAKRLAKSA